MIYSVDKIKELLKSNDEFVHVRLSSQPEGYGVKLINSGGKVISELPLYTGAYIVCMDLPMSVSVLKRVLNKRGPVKFLNRDGVLGVYVKSINTKQGATSDGGMINFTAPVWAYSTSNQQKLKTRATQINRKMEWIKKNGLDFGAVDIVESREGNAAVLEVNTSPSLEGQTLDSYVNMIRGLL